MKVNKQTCLCVRSMSGKQMWSRWGEGDNYKHPTIDALKLLLRNSVRG